MRSSDIVSIVVNGIFGAITGALLGGTFLAIALTVVGVTFGYGAARANVRPGVAMTVFVGAMSGALIGSSIVNAICLPASCVPLETTAGVVVGIGAFFGVGVVAALVTRSFDEYNERSDAGLPPPGVGCEVPGDDAAP